MDANAIYDTMRFEVERLERGAARSPEWTRLSIDVLEALMDCQSIVIDLQRKMNALRGTSDFEAYRLLRQASRDALQAVDNLTALYRRVQAKIT